MALKTTWSTENPVRKSASTFSDMTDSTADSMSLSVQPSELLKINEAEEQKKIKIDEIGSSIELSLSKDTSPQARLGRQKIALRAAYGEFMCTTLFYTPIFATIVNCTRSGMDPSVTSLCVAFVGGLQAIAVSFAFSSVSGAHFNGAVSFALWLTGKLSNRKAAMYILVQLLASIVGMLLVTLMFTGDLKNEYIACAVTPLENQNLGKVFATEAVLTFTLTYVAFTVAFEVCRSMNCAPTARFRLVE
jgi:glycerol uptake facilitator-like aquaporin